ncbi:MAG: hypothetical protein MUQ26_05760 [Armatimonadetes bacterium]|nr:hypothetical protein [Armatimonadota bacterium]
MSGTKPPDDPGLTDEAIEEMTRKRFEARVNRVLAAMKEERIDWRGVPLVTPDGRIGVRVVPVEMEQP